jgi:hypothetical protein
MLISTELKDWGIDLKTVLFDINVTTNNLYILNHENSYNFRTRHSEVYINLWYQQYFICIIQLTKLFSVSGQQKRNISKLCKKITLGDFDDELKPQLVLNNTKLNDVLRSKEELILIVSQIALEMENKSVIIKKLNYLRDKVFAHTDPNTQEYDISIEELVCLKDFANNIYNNIFGKIFDEYYHFQLTRQYDFRSIIEAFMK